MRINFAGNVYIKLVTNFSEHQKGTASFLAATGFTKHRNAPTRRVPLFTKAILPVCNKRFNFKLHRI
jgi:hypothetical protein